MDKLHSLTFLDIGNIDTSTFLALLQPPLEGPGEVVFGEGPDYPLQLVLELLLGHGDACQLSFCGDEEKVCLRQFRQLGGVRKDLDRLFGQECLDFLGRGERQLVDPSF